MGCTCGGMGISCWDGGNGCVEVRSTLVRLKLVIEFVVDLTPEAFVVGERPAGSASTGSLMLVDTSSGNPSGNAGCAKPGFPVYASEDANSVSLLAVFVGKPVLLIAALDSSVGSRKVLSSMHVLNDVDVSSSVGNHRQLAIIFESYL